MSSAQYFTFHVKSLSGELIPCSFSLPEGAILSLEYVYYYVWHYLPSEYKEGHEQWHLKLFVNDDDCNSVIDAIQRSETIYFLIQSDIVIQVSHQNTSFGPTGKMRDVQGNLYSTHQLTVTYSDDNSLNRWDILFIGRRDEDGLLHMFHRNDITRPAFSSTSSMSYHCNVFYADDNECDTIAKLHERAIYHDPGLWYDFPPSAIFYVFQKWNTLLQYNL